MGHRKYYDSSNGVKSLQTDIVDIEDGISNNQYIDKIKQFSQENCGKAEDEIPWNDEVNHGDCEVKKISGLSPEDEFSKYNFFFYKKKKDSSEQHLWGKTSRYIRTKLKAPKCSYNFNEEVVIESPKIRNELIEYPTVIEFNFSNEQIMNISDDISTSSENVFKKTSMGSPLKKSVSPIIDASVSEEMNNDKHIIISERNGNMKFLQPHDPPHKISFENQQSRKPIVQRSTPDMNRFENYSRKRLQTSGNGNDFVFDFGSLENEKTTVHNEKNPHAKNILKLIYNVNINGKRRILTKLMKNWIPILFVALTVMYFIFYVKIFSKV